MSRYDNSKKEVVAIKRSHDLSDESQFDCKMTPPIIGKNSRVISSAKRMKKEASHPPKLHVSPPYLKPENSFHMRNSTEMDTSEEKKDTHVPTRASTPIPRMGTTPPNTRSSLFLNSAFSTELTKELTKILTQNPNLNRESESSRPSCLSLNPRCTSLPFIHDELDRSSSSESEEELRYECRRDNKSPELDSVFKTFQRVTESQPSFKTPTVRIGSDQDYRSVSTPQIERPLSNSCFSSIWKQRSTASSTDLSKAETSGFRFNTATL